MKRFGLILRFTALLAFAATAGAQTFSDTWGSAGFNSKEASQGVALTDYDHDGKPDLFISSLFIKNPIPFFPDLGGPDRLYKNSGAASFSDVAPAVGLNDNGQAQGAAWGDYDNDHRPDLYVVRGFQQSFPQSHLLFHQTPTGTFDGSPSAYVQAAGAGRSVCWADYDNDGYLDVFVTNGVDSPDALPDAHYFLFHNNRDGSFTDMTDQVGVLDHRNGYGCSWSDFDNDGDMDLYVANHGFEDPVLGYKDPQPSVLYKNLLRETGKATFVDVAAAAGVDNMTPIVPGQPGSSASFGVCWLDYNNDGWMDIFITNGFSGIIPFPTPNRLYLNKKDGTFQDASLEILDPDFDESSYSCSAADYNNDGNIDVFVSNADIPFVARATDDLLVNGGWPLYVLTNQEAAAGVAVQEWSTACASADFNGDGYVDIYSINGIPAVELAVERADNLFMNNGGPNHWLELDLEGVYSNRDGIGARVRLDTGGPLGKQTREVSAGQGYQSMDDLRVEFGLGAKTQAQTLTIRWPSGCVQTLTNVAAGQILHVLEDCTIVDPGNTDLILRQKLQTPVSGMFPLPAYKLAPITTWQDPEDVIPLPDSYFYQHSMGTVTIKLVKQAGTVSLAW